MSGSWNLFRYTMRCLLPAPLCSVHWALCFSCCSGLFQAHGVWERLGCLLHGGDFTLSYIPIWGEESGISEMREIRSCQNWEFGVQEHQQEERMTGRRMKQILLLWGQPPVFQNTDLMEREAAGNPARDVSVVLCFCPGFAESGIKIVFIFKNVSI